MIVLLAVGCGAPAIPIQPTSTSSPVVEFEVTFDGNECTFSGPTELPTGRYRFALDDLSDKQVDLWVGRLLEGKTVQDLLDEQGEPGRWWPKPSWFFYDEGILWKEENDKGIWSYLLEEEGEHVIYVGIDLEDIRNLWFCAKTVQIQAPSE